MCALPNSGILFQYYSNKINVPQPVYYLVNGVETLLPNYTLVARRALNTSLHLNAVGWIEILDSANQVITTLDRTKYDKFHLYTSGKYCYTGDYKLVKNMDIWKHIYGVKMAAFHQLKKQTGQELQISVPAAYCRGNCGLFLPVRNLTVDHQKPQSVGAIGAVQRVFRGFGLTGGGPKGKKNKLALLMFASDVGGDETKLPSNDPVQQNELTFMGLLYYNVLKAQNSINDLKEICMHHFLNLRPMCGPCNSSRGNKYVQY